MCKYRDSCLCLTRVWRENSDWERTPGLFPVVLTSIQGAPRGCWCLSDGVVYSQWGQSDGLDMIRRQPDPSQLMLLGLLGTRCCAWELPRFPGPHHATSVLSFADSLISVTEIYMFFFCKTAKALMSLELLNWVCPCKILCRFGAGSSFSHSILLCFLESSCNFTLAFPLLADVFLICTCPYKKGETPSALFP